MDVDFLSHTTHDATVQDVQPPHHFFALQPSSSPPALMDAHPSHNPLPIIPFSSSCIAPSSSTSLLIKPSYTLCCCLLFNLLTHCYLRLSSSAPSTFAPMNLQLTRKEVHSEAICKNSNLHTPPAASFNHHLTLMLIYTHVLDFV